jgi:Arc/MetJ-type ribon-helix-helix transcriptional regulator
MTNMTFAVPEELHTIMKRHSEVRWSEIVRKALREHAQKIEAIDKILSKSKLTEEDVLKLGRKVNQDLAKKHGLKE